MKAIILAASIFYVLGLTLSNNIDISIKTNQVDSITTPKIIKHKFSDSLESSSNPKHKCETGTISELEIAEKEDSKS